ncbi:hypothetical protein [Candidatus Nitrospira salsa]
MSIGISFGVNENAYRSFIAEGVTANPTVHDENSQDKIWRYAQRVHFHATGISAFSLGLVILVMFSDLTSRLKKRISVSRVQQLVSAFIVHHVFVSTINWSWTMNMWSQRSLRMPV